jgi:hypothetical protein
MTTSVQDLRLISAIAERAVRLYQRSGITVKPSFISSELHFVHEKICRLRLREMLDADEGNLMHDVAGIHRHLDMVTERLTAGFCPRFAIFERELGR